MNFTTNTSLSFKQVQAAAKIASIAEYWPTTIGPVASSAPVNADPAAVWLLRLSVSVFFVSPSRLPHFGCGFVLELMETIRLLGARLLSAARTRHIPAFVSPTFKPPLR